MKFFLDPPSLAELASLRDRVIVAETRAILLEDIAESALRRAKAYRREPRKDKASIVAARAAMTARLKAEMGRG